jgi:hypothetical protein
VIITDSVGRAWRKGTVGIAIGTAGIAPYRDLRGTRDRTGRPLQVSEIAPADSLAAAAVLLMGEAAEGTPAVLIAAPLAAATTFPPRWCSGRRPKTSSADQLSWLRPPTPGCSCPAASAARSSRSASTGCSRAAPSP